MANRITFTRSEWNVVRQDYSVTFVQADLEEFIKHYSIKDLTVEELINIIEEKNEEVKKSMSFNGKDFKDEVIYDIFFEYILDYALSNGPVDEEYVDFEDSEEEIEVERDIKED
jgi:hypothetical protein